MSPSTMSRNLWTMNPSRMTYRDHGKPRLLSSRICTSTLSDLNLTANLFMPVLQDPSSPSYGMCYSAIMSSRCVFRSCLVLIAACWCCCLCAEPSSRLRDRTSFGRYDRGIRLAMIVMPSVTRPLAF